MLSFIWQRGRFKPFISEVDFDRNSQFQLRRCSCFVKMHIFHWIVTSSYCIFPYPFRFLFCNFNLLDFELIGLQCGEELGQMLLNLSKAWEQADSSTSGSIVSNFPLLGETLSDSVKAGKSKVILHVL